MNAHKIPLAGGGVCLISAEDNDLVSGLIWKPLRDKHNVYAKHVEYSQGKAVVFVLMHRLIMAAPTGLVVDHINGDGLDNRRENLRLVTTAENSLNRRARADNGTGYRGVAAAPNGKYYAAFCWGGVKKHLGTFVSAEEAAAAWDEYAKHYHGEFASLNSGPRITEQRARAALASRVRA